MEIKNIVVSGNNLFTLYFALYLKHKIKNINVFLKYNDFEYNNFIVFSSEQINNFLKSINVKISNSNPIKNNKYLNFNNDIDIILDKENMYNFDYTYLKNNIMEEVKKSISIFNDELNLNLEETYYVHLGCDEQNNITHILNKNKIIYGATKKINGNQNIFINDKKYYFFEYPCLDRSWVGICFNDRNINETSAKELLSKKYHTLDCVTMSKIKNSYNENPCGLTSLCVEPISNFLEPICNTSFIVMHELSKMFCELLTKTENCIDFDFCYFFNKNYQLLVESQIIFVESFYCLQKESIYYQSYIDKLDTFGWPSFYGDEVKESIFKGFDKINDAKKFNVKIYELEDYISIKDTI